MWGMLVLFLRKKKIKLTYKRGSWKKRASVSNMLIIVQKKVASWQTHKGGSLTRENTMHDLQSAFCRAIQVEKTYGKKSSNYSLWILWSKNK